MMKIPYAIAITAALLFNPLLATAKSSCDLPVFPVTSVADLDANGVVNGKDIAILAKNIGKGNKKGTYSLLYDRNNDQKLDNIDVFLATREMGKKSKPEDRANAEIFIAILAGTYTCVEAATVKTKPKTTTTTDEKAAADLSSGGSFSFSM